MKYLILALLLGCSSAPKHLEINGFEKYVAMFEAESCRHNLCIKVDNVIIKFDNLEVPKIGLTTLHDDGSTPQIRFDYKYWANSTELDREELFLHEIGHAILYKKHQEESILEGNCPSSIMNFKHMGPSCFNAYKEHYLNEYFN